MNTPISISKLKLAFYCLDYFFGLAVWIYYFKGVKFTSHRASVTWFEF